MVHQISEIVLGIEVVISLVITAPLTLPFHLGFLESFGLGGVELLLHWAHVDWGSSFALHLASWDLSKVAIGRSSLDEDVWLLEFQLSIDFLLPVLHDITSEPTLHQSEFVYVEGKERTE